MKFAKPIPQSQFSLWAGVKSNKLQRNHRKMRRPGGCVARTIIQSRSDVATNDDPRNYGIGHIIPVRNGINRQENQPRDRQAMFVMLGKNILKSELMKMCLYEDPGDIGRPFIQKMKVDSIMQNKNKR